MCLVNFWMNAFSCYSLDVWMNSKQNQNMQSKYHCIKNQISINRLERLQYSWVYINFSKSKQLPIAAIKSFESGTHSSLPSSESKKYILLGTLFLFLFLRFFLFFLGFLTLNASLLVVDPTGWGSSMAGC